MTQANRKKKYEISQVNNDREKFGVINKTKWQYDLENFVNMLLDL